MYTQRRMTPAGTSIPDNYGGNAFRYPPIGSLPAEQPPSPDATSAPEAAPLLRAPMIALGDGFEQAREEARDSGIFEQKTSLFPAPIFGGHSFGSEEILLIGLFLLLAGDGVIGPGKDKEKSDLLLYLLLLFFCG